MTRIVFVTQRVDPVHPTLAATIAKIRALAARVDEVVVLALSSQPGLLPENCRVRPFGSALKPGRLVRYEALLADELRRRPERLVAHMAPVYAVLAAPLARAFGVRSLLWYTHWRRSPTLRLAERLVDRVVSVDRRSFPIASDKVVGIGHGIDLDEFRCAARNGNGLHALALGRTSPTKGLETVIRAVTQVEGASLTICGPSLTPLERRHRAELERLAAGLPVTIRDAIPRAEVPELFATADLLVNNMLPGAADKVVYEAAASCLPVLASNPSFADLLEPFPRDDADELARRLRAFAALRGDERARIGRELRATVAERHSVDSWAEGVLAA
jgi:glycosyltransferase involved in cell wall biosynthesis